MRHSRWRVVFQRPRTVFLPQDLFLLQVGMGERVRGEVAVREAQAVGVAEAADVRIVNGGYRCG